MGNLDAVSFGAERRNLQLFFLRRDSGIEKWNLPRDRFFEMSFKCGICVYHDPADLLLVHKGSLNSLIPVESNVLFRPARCKTPSVLSFLRRAGLSCARPVRRLQPSAFSLQPAACSLQPAACLGTCSVLQVEHRHRAPSLDSCLSLTSVLTKVPLVADEKCHRLRPQRLSQFLRDDG